MAGVLFNENDVTDYVKALEGYFRERINERQSAIFDDDDMDLQTLYVAKGYVNALEEAITSLYAITN